jgi:hypothetical protein
MKSARNILALLVLTLLVAPALAAERTIELTLDGADAVELHNLAGAAQHRARLRRTRDPGAHPRRPARARGRGGPAPQGPAAAWPRWWWSTRPGLSRIRYDGDEFQRLDASVEYQESPGPRQQQGRRPRPRRPRGPRARERPARVPPAHRADHRRGRERRPDPGVELRRHPRHRRRRTPGGQHEAPAGSTWRVSAARRTPAPAAARSRSRTCWATCAPAPARAA